MSGGGRTVFFGLIGIMICLVTAFVLRQQHQQRLREREREKTTAQPTKTVAPPAPPGRRGAGRP